MDLWRVGWPTEGRVGEHDRCEEEAEDFPGRRQKEQPCTQDQINVRLNLHLLEEDPIELKKAQIYPIQYHLTEV